MMNVVPSLRKFLILPCMQSTVLLPVTHTSQCTDLPAGLGSHMTVPRWSCALGTKRMGSASLPHTVLPLVDVRFPRVSLTLELEYEDVAF